ncbi:MAG: hypothetical protein RL208_808, partial [Pseudomonadota bacterium]
MVNNKEERARFELLKQRLEELNRAYYDENSPRVSDEEYDALKREFLGLKLKLGLLFEDDVGYKPNSRFKKIVHSKSMLSLDNALNFEDLSDFFAKIKRFLDISYEPEVVGE